MCWGLRVFRWEPASSGLGNLTLPAKSRHGHFSEVKIALTLILGDRLDLLQDAFHSPGWDYHALLVVEEDVLLADGMLLRSGHLTDRVERTRDIRQLPVAPDCPVLRLQLGGAAAILLYLRVVRANEVPESIATEILTFSFVAAMSSSSSSMSMFTWPSFLTHAASFSSGS